MALLSSMLHSFEIKERILKNASIVLKSDVQGDGPQKVHKVVKVAHDCDNRRSVRTAKFLRRQDEPNDCEGVVRFG